MVYSTRGSWCAECELRCQQTQDWLAETEEVVEGGKAGPSWGDDGHSRSLTCCHLCRSRSVTGGILVDTPCNRVMVGWSLGQEWGWRHNLRGRRKNTLHYSPATTPQKWLIPHGEREQSCYSRHRCLTAGKRLSKMEKCYNTSLFGPVFCHGMLCRKAQRRNKTQNTMFNKDPKESTTQTTLRAYTQENQGAKEKQHR